MKRQKIVSGAFTFIIDVFDAFVDMEDEAHYSNFVMLRNFTLTNDITTDTDIIFIDKEIFDELVVDLHDNGDTQSSEKFVWPIPSLASRDFSNTATGFNSNFLNESLYNLDTYFDENDYELGYDVYKLLKSDGTSYQDIKCNKVRIYRPSNCFNKDYIIYVDNWMNNIHFHYFCKRYDNFETNSNTMFKYNNQEYFEYIEFYIPNIHDLFRQNKDGSYNVYYKEDLDIISSKENENFMSEITTFSDNIYRSDDGTQIVPLHLLLQPFRIVEEDGHNVKQYLKIIKSIENNYLTHPFNITLYGFTGYDESSGQYHISELYESATNSFITPCRFSISSKLGFSNGKIALINKFIYPDSNKFEGISGKSTMLAAYEYYNNVNAAMYNDFSDEQYELLYADIDALMYQDLTDMDIDSVYEKYEIKKDTLSKAQVLSLYKQMKKDAIRLEYEEDLESATDFLGFRVQLSTDINFTRILYERNITIRFSELDDFSFELNNIFTSWDELPEYLNARVIFVDRFLGTIINGNMVVITKEWFKYMVNDINVYSISKLGIVNKNYNTRIKLDDIEEMKEFTLASDKVNFLNNITCIVRKIDDNNLQTETQVKTNKPKVLYRPVFYRVSDLQNIRLRANMTQKIGINLVDYMTKVETFKMLIDGTEYTECARNDVYVIFNINAAILSDTSGQYDISNQDGEYISTGNWSVY